MTIFVIITKFTHKLELLYTEKLGYTTGVDIILNYAVISMKKPKICPKRSSCNRI